MVQCDSVVIPNSIHADNLKQMMRKVEDDIITFLATFKPTMNDSTEDSSVALELVGYMQLVSELKEQLQDSEAALTKAQAREAVTEAECNSVKKILSKTNEKFEKQQENLSISTKALAKLKKVAEESELTAESYLKVIEGKDGLLETLRSEIEKVDPRLLLPETTNFQNIVNQKDTQIRELREKIEDWAILSNYSVKYIASHYPCCLQLQKLIGSPVSKELSFTDLLLVDPESFPDEIDQFLASHEQLAKQTYEKIQSALSLDTSALTNDIKVLITQSKSELSRRVTFQK